MAGSQPISLQNADRRRAPRSIDAQGETVLLWIEGVPPQTAVFLDETDLGIGVALRDPMPLKIGQPIEVVFRGTVRGGIVSSLRNYSDVTRVGLEWSHSESMGATSL